MSYASARFLASPNSQFLNTQSTAYAAAPLLPSQVTTAVNVLWLEADYGITTNVSGVTQWADRSPQLSNAVQLTPGAEPIYGIVAGKPAVSSTGTRFMTMPMNTNHRLASNVRTYFYIVARSSDNNTARGPFGRYQGTEYAFNWTGTTTAQQDFFVGAAAVTRNYSTIIDNVDHLLWAYYLHNGVNPGIITLGVDAFRYAPGSRNVPTAGVTDTYIGRWAAAGGALVADIRAIVMFRASASDMRLDEQQGVMAYLTQKWCQ